MSALQKRPSISAFFPAYNDAATIGSVVRAAGRVLAGIGCEFEVVVVDDGSSDGTGRVLEELSAECPFLRVITHERNRGYGGALISGFSNCRNDLIFYTDGDGQYDVGELLTLLEGLGPDVDLVNGYKIRRADPAYRRVIGRLYHHAVTLLFGIRARDVDCDFRLFRRDLLDRVELKCCSGVICVEMLKKFQLAGGRMVERPVHHYPRSSGRSQFFRPRHILGVFRQIFGLWFELVVRGKLCRPVPAESARPILDP